MCSSPHRMFDVIRLRSEQNWTRLMRNIYTVPYVLALIAVIVSVDFLFFRNRFWERLMVNIGIVLVFGAFYFRFLKKR